VLDKFYQQTTTLQPQPDKSTQNTILFKFKLTIKLNMPYNNTKR